MARRMLIDASHPEETRVVVVDGTKLTEFDFETASRKPLKGNIYLAKVIRIEPSLQAAFVEYGGNRHGFLAFSEIHPDYFQIPDQDIRHLASVLTVVNGEVVYGAEEFSELAPPLPPASPDWAPVRRRGALVTAADLTAARITVPGKTHAPHAGASVTRGGLQPLWGSLGCGCWAY